MSVHFASPDKQRLWGAWQRLDAGTARERRAVLDSLYHPETQWHGPHPLNGLSGLDALEEGFYTPFHYAFPDLAKRPYILMEDTFKEERWLCATGDFVGTFAQDWLGVPATKTPVRLRFGEFCHMREGKVVESYLILDLVSLSEQAGYPILPPSRGRGEPIPGPHTGDGLVTSAQDPKRSAQSLELVESMIFDGLMRYDGRNLSSMNMTRFWTPDMRWYGPAGIGSAHGLKEFEDVHQRTFLRAFPDRRGGHHKARLAEGAYVASTGWPSIQATHAGDYLGCLATNRRITMRVMDWWRREGEELAENWVFVDLLDLFMQFGVDLHARLISQVAERGYRDESQAATEDT